MRGLKEDIACRTNREDGCTGAFWERRFTSVPLLDNAALVACMAYVDLNPVRAKVAPTPEDSLHTGGRTRIRPRTRWQTAVTLRVRGRDPARVQRLLERAGLDARATHAEDGLWLTSMVQGRVAAPAGGVAAGLDDALTLDECLNLLDATGRTLAHGKRGAIDPRLAPILARLDLRVEDRIVTMVGWRMLWGGSAIGRHATRPLRRRGADWIGSATAVRCSLFAVRPGMTLVRLLRKERLRRDEVVVGQE